MTLGLVGTGLLVQAQDPEPSPRLRYTINSDWRYAPDSTDAPAAPHFDDSRWEAVNLPHTWNAADAFDDDLSYRRGLGWYRKELALDPVLEGQRLYLYFEGANQVADVYVNGQHAGQHIGGYTAFVFDITDLVHFDRPNTVAVRVNNRHDPDIPPLDADFTFYGGIYRDVWLLATRPVHIEVTDHAGPGVYIDTPEVSEEAATVRVRSTVVNDSNQPASVALAHHIRDADGQAVATLRAEREVAPGERAAFDQTSDPITRPHLWAPEEPYLYHVITEVYRGDSLVDRTRNPLGFRWFSADGDGFTFNGEPLPLYGTNRHQDRPVLGNALPNGAHRQDVRLIDEDGFNFLRLAHYPQDPVVLDEADRRGLLVWEEVPVVNTITMSDAFGNNAESMLVDMIRQHYNHPSVVMWGYMNEIMLREPDPLPEGYRGAVLALAQRLEARLKEEDPHRLSVTAQSYGEVYNGVGVSDVTDILGMNLYFGWYYEELESLGTFLDTLHQQHPGRPLLVSEYGAGSDERIHTEAPVPFDFSTEYQRRFHEADFRQIRERPYMVGSAVWNQFDFGSNHRQDTKHSINQKGIYFFDRTPKGIAYYYRAQLHDEPVLHIATREWIRRAGSRPEDRQQPVTVYTNLDEVELLLNGTSLGMQPVANSTARWDVPFRDGTNVLQARGQRGGDTVIDQVDVHYDDRTAFFDSTTNTVNVVAINAGGHSQFIDDADTVWEPDRAYAGGRWGYEGGEPARTNHRIFNTPDDPLYQAAHEGMTAYRFDVPDGWYEVDLGFLEHRYDEAGQRVFSVQVNDNPVFTDVDLAAQYGRYHAVTRSVAVQAAAERGIVLRFDASAGEPTLSSILLRRLP